MPQGVEIPLKATLMRRISAGLSYVVTGTPNPWFGPWQPIAPVAKPDPRGRAWDFPVAVNVDYEPRSTESVKFGLLRGLADNYDIIRTVIETWKDQIVKLKWKFQLKDKTKDSDADPRISELYQFFEYPDKINDYTTWQRMLLEDIAVIDAPTIYKRYTKGGKLYALQQIDGALIKPVLDEDGLPPAPPDVAYQEILKGVPATNYTWNELIYKPRNRRIHKMYGFSYVEQILTTIIMAMNRMELQYEYYAGGNTPDGLLFMPESYTADQVLEYMKRFNALMAGQARNRTKFMPVPGGTGSKYQDARKWDVKDETDEWFARVVCFTFSIAPTPFIKQMNRAVAETQKEQSAAEGIEPMKMYFQSLMNAYVSRTWGYNDIEFAWQEDEAIDPLEQAQIDQINVQNGIRTGESIAEERGYVSPTTEQPEQPVEKVYKSVKKKSLQSQHIPNAHDRQRSAWVNY